MNSLATSARAAQLLLGLVAAAVILLYLLRPSPRRLNLGSTLIWRRVLRSRKRTPDRLRWWLSLVLALLIALFVALAITQPQLPGSSGGPRKLVLVLDDSITLSTRTADGRTRWDHAIERAGELIRAGSAGSRYLVADTQGQVVSPRFQEERAALAMLEHLQPQPGGTGAFPELIESQDAGVQTVLISDGVMPLRPPPRTETLSVFETADNAGITAFQVRGMPADRRRQQAYVEVANASRKPRDVELSVSGAGHEPLVRELRLASGGNAGEVFDVSMFSGGPLRAAVSMAGDALLIDDVAYSYLPPRRVLHVGLVTAGNAALERSLRLLPRVEVSVVAPGRYRERGGVDAWVFDRFAPRRAPVSPSLLFRPSPVAWLPAVDGYRDAAAVSAWVRSHALTDGLSLRDVLVRRSLATRADARFESIASDAEHHPLILASLSGPRRVEAAFALDDSNLSLQPGFPVFLSNALDWMTGEPPVLQAALGAVEIPLRADKVLDMQGRPVASRALPAATLVEVRQPGFLTAIASDYRLPVAVSALDPAVTDVNASRLAERSAAPRATASMRWAMEAWLLLLLVAAMLLVLEWWTFNRRLTV